MWRIQTVASGSIQFDHVHDLLRAVLAQLLADLEAGAVDWLRPEGGVGSPSRVEENMLATSRNLQPHARLLCAIDDAARANPQLRRMWREQIVQSRIDAVEAAIRRDQDAGVLRRDLDPVDTARALTLMNETLALEILGRRNGSPEEFARLTAPVWHHVLFDDDTR